MNVKYYKELDGMRGLAALMVFFSHFPLGTSISVADKIGKLAHTGLMYFFVLTGFLITRILLANKGADHYYRNFYVRRILRIFPLYYLALIIYLFIVPLIYHLPIPGFEVQRWYWIYLQNIAFSFRWITDGPHHLWSLAVEEHFYLIWPVLIVICTQKQLFKTAFILVGVAIISRLWLMHNIAAVHYFTLSCCDSMALGGLLAAIERKGLLMKYKAANKQLLLWSLGILLVTGMFFDYNNPAIVQIRPLTISVFYFSLIWYMVTSAENNWLNRALRNKPLLYVSLISYGVYVYHPMCNFMVQTHFPALPNLLKFISSLGLTIIISSISYFLYEKWFIGLKKYF
jgi:peptidoglycan/LPS O-acetylase OafA/YrhL